MGLGSAREGSCLLNNRRRLTAAGLERLPDIPPPGRRRLQTVPPGVLIPGQPALFVFLDGAVLQAVPVDLDIGRPGALAEGEMISGSAAGAAVRSRLSHGSGTPPPCNAQRHRLRPP